MSIDRKEPRFEEVEVSPNYQGEVIRMDSLEALAGFVRELDLHPGRPLKSAPLVRAASDSDEEIPPR